MLLISCPWCGDRDQSEFSYHGEAHIARPPTPDKLSDEEWADYLFFRANPKGLHHEIWMHAFGCRQFFNMARNTASGEILGAYRIGEQPPVKAGAATAADSADAAAAADAADSTGAAEAAK